MSCDLTPSKIKQIVPKTVFAPFVSPFHPLCHRHKCVSEKCAECMHEYTFKCIGSNISREVAGWVSHLIFQGFEDLFTVTIPHFNCSLNDFLQRLGSFLHLTSEKEAGCCHKLYKGMNSNMSTVRQNELKPRLACCRATYNRYLHMVLYFGTTLA